MAERVGFEPTVPVKVQQFSRLPDSTTLAPLRECKILPICIANVQVASELRLAAGTKEVLQQRAAFVGENAAGDLDLVI